MIDFENEDPLLSWLKPLFILWLISLGGRQ